jgi:hypothetical protein
MKCSLKIRKSIHHLRQTFGFAKEIFFGFLKKGLSFDFKAIIGTNSCHLKTSLTMKLKK